MPDGTQMTIVGLARRLWCTFSMKYRSIFSQMSKSAMTPSRSGRMAWMWLGVRPIMRLASAPTASGRPSTVLIATTDGSLRTMPSPRTYTSVLAVPRSTAMSRPIAPMRLPIKDLLTTSAPLLVASVDAAYDTLLTSNKRASAATYSDSDSRRVSQDRNVHPQGHDPHGPNEPHVAHVPHVGHTP